MKAFPLLLALMPAVSLGDTLLCIPDVAAVVEDGGNRPATSAVADASDHKFLLKKEGAQWVLKRFGDEGTMFPCRKSDGAFPYFCERDDGLYGGTFMRTDAGAFSISWMNQKADRNLWIVAKGRCSAV